MEKLKRAKKAVFDQSRQYDSSGALADTNENREIAADNFYNEENLKADEDRAERKKFYEKTAKLKKARARAIDANNKHFAKKQKNKLKKQSMPKPKSYAR